jgi:asparagine synthase (glutamine-hydrolysing)
MTTQSNVVVNNNLINEKEWVEYISSLENAYDNLETNKERVKRKLKISLINSIKTRLPTQKFGVLFSGGLDSTIIALICKNLNTGFICYTIGLENSPDLVWAKKIADYYKFNLKVKILNLDEIKVVVKKTLKILKEPDIVKIGVGSVLYTALLLAKQDNINILFSGLGSEEIFCGYQRHQDTLINGFEAVHKESWKGLKNMWQRDLKRDFLIAKHFNAVLLTPFLDKKLIITAMSIHPMYKISSQEKKIILRELAEELGLRSEFALRKKKAAQYGSHIHKAIEKLAKKQGFSYIKDYLHSLIQFDKYVKDNQIY